MTTELKERIENFACADALGSSALIGPNRRSQFNGTPGSDYQFLLTNQDDKYSCRFELFRGNTCFRCETIKPKHTLEIDLTMDNQGTVTIVNYTSTGIDNRPMLHVQCS